MSADRKVTIIGSGPAGLTAAIYAGRANLAPILLHGPLPGGQLTTTTEVENYPGFPDGIMGPELMQMMEAQAKRFGTEIVVSTVTELDLKKHPFTVKAGNKSFTTEAVILATGATPRLLGVKGEKELMGFGVSTCATCDGAFFRDRIIMVVGGGDSACEEANFLTRFGSKVLLVHRRGELRASKIMRERVLRNPKVEPVWNTVLTEIRGDKKGGVTSVVGKSTVDGSEREIKCDAVFVAIGHTPNSQLVRGVIDTDENGYVLTRPHSTATNVEGVFACGDLQDHIWRQAVTAAGSGCMAAIDCERWLAQREE